MRRPTRCCRIALNKEAQPGAPRLVFETWDGDRWGNRWAQNALNGGPSPQFTYNTANNQISGYTYDAAGNLTNDGAHTYTYDAEGNIIAVDGGTTATYVYNALNQRVESIMGGVTNEYGYDINGNKVETWPQPIEIANEGQIYWGKMLLAYRSNDGTTYFEHQDWLGNTRLRTDYLGNVAATFTSLPFGDGNSSTINKSAAGQDNTHFAMLDLDSESDTDHATFRQYGNIQGRWMSPDPYGGSYDPSNPQSMNRYSYVSNNPLAYVDPDGTTQEPNQPCDVAHNCYPQPPVTVTPPPDPPPPDPCDGYACSGYNGPGGGPTGGPSIPPAGGPSGIGGPGLPGAPSKDPCANAVLSQAGVDARQQIAQAQSAMLNSNGPFGNLAAYGGTVGTGGPNDIKNLPGHSPQNPIDVAAGNISFGITCPFGAGFCQFAAGLAQTLSGNPNFQGALATGFDTPSDNAQIRIGQAMRAAGCHE